jgi:hypothetical protein
MIKMEKYTFSPLLAQHLNTVTDKAPIIFLWKARVKVLCKNDSRTTIQYQKVISDKKNFVLLARKRDAQKHCHN